MKTKIKEQLSDVQKIIAASDSRGKFYLVEKEIILSKLRYVYELVSSQVVDSGAAEKGEVMQGLEMPSVAVQSQEARVVHDAVAAKTEAPVESVPTFANGKIDATKVRSTGEPGQTVARESTPANPVPEKVEVVVPRAEQEPERLEKQAVPLQAQVQPHVHQPQAHHPQGGSVKLKPNKITDIAKAIGINDKILFVKQLFSGNNNLYLATITRLNSYDTMAQAEEYLQETFLWDQDDAVVIKFFDVVKRRY